LEQAQVSLAQAHLDLHEQTALTQAHLAPQAHSSLQQAHLVEHAQDFLAQAHFAAQALDFVQQAALAAHSQESLAQELFCSQQHGFFALAQAPHAVTGLQQALPHAVEGALQHGTALMTQLPQVPLSPPILMPVTQGGQHPAIVLSVDAGLAVGVYSMASNAPHEGEPEHGWPTGVCSQRIEFTI
jgi:hypothetical protein